MSSPVSHRRRRHRMDIPVQAQLGVFLVTTVLLSVVILLDASSGVHGAVIVAQQEQSNEATTMHIRTQQMGAETNNSSFKIVVKDYPEADGKPLLAEVPRNNETDKGSSSPSPTVAVEVTTTKSPTNHSRRSLKSGGMVSSGTASASRNNTQLLSVLAARRSLLHNRSGSGGGGSNIVPHQRGVHNYVIQQTMCERNCTKNFTVRGTAQCMRRCAIPSPARRRGAGGDPQASSSVATTLNDEPKINANLENDNNLSEINSVGGAATDELLVTNESTASHLIYREIFDATLGNNSNRGGGGGSNLLIERNRSKKNLTLTKDLYSPFKSGQYYIESRAKSRAGSPGKATKFEGEQLEFGQKLPISIVTSTTEKSSKSAAVGNSRPVVATRNLVASHRRGMLNFKSSLLPSPLSISAIPRPDNTFGEVFVKQPVVVVVEDARTEETRPSSIVTVSGEEGEVAPVETIVAISRKNHGIILDLPPSTIQLDTRGAVSGGGVGFEKEIRNRFVAPVLFDQIVVPETTENDLPQEQSTSPTVEERKEEGIIRQFVVPTEKFTIADTTPATTNETPIVTTVENVSKEQEKQMISTTEATTTYSVLDEVNVSKDTDKSPSDDVLPSISALFPNISKVTSLLLPNDTELPLASVQNERSTESPPPTPKLQTIAPTAVTGSSNVTKLDPVGMVIQPETTTPQLPTTTSTLQTPIEQSSSTSAPISTTTTTTTEKAPYKPLPSRGYKPSTTTLRPVVPKRTDFTPSSIDTVDFRRTTSTPIKRFSPRPKKPSTSTTSSSSLSSTSSITSPVPSTTTHPTTMRPPPTEEEKKESIPRNIPTPPNTSFESIFNLSAIFQKAPKVIPTTTTAPSSAEDEQMNKTIISTTTAFAIPSPTIPEADRVLLGDPNTDVTIELQRMNMATYVLAGLGMFPIVIIILYVIKTIIYNKQMKNGPQAVPVEPFGGGDHKISQVVMKVDGSGGVVNEAADDALKEIEFPRMNLRFKSILGEGNFGQVWKAEADDLPGHMSTTRIVAVKTERPEHGTGGLKQEGEIMFKLGSHPNVVTLLGCCVQEEPHLLIMEFAMRGRLLSLLRAARSAIHSMGGNVGTVRSSAIPLSPRRLSGFAHDIARGMEYIASKNIVHRDLAARNILLDHNGVCKICDFGMSMDLKKQKPTHVQSSRTMGRGGLHHNSFENNLLWETDLRTGSGNCTERRFEVCRSDSGVGGGAKPTRPALPIRWMAPEALLHHVFSIETDVWAFGIVLWEIATLGCTPYPNLSGREVVRSIPSGVRPEIPPNCRPELFKLMAKTWHKDPRQRPSFAEARNELGHALRQWEMEQENTSEYLDVSGFSEDLEHGMVYFNRRISEFECEI